MSVFENEIKILNRCRNENIINYIDVMKTKSNFYIILEYCEGGNLAEYIARHGKLNESEAVKIFVQLIKGMNAMSKINVIHRDLKPANIMMKEGNIKIADFGLAVKYSKGEMFKTYAGSPFNMAPEILKGCLYNDKVDVYSAGTVLYEMLLGVVPHLGVDLPALIKKIDENNIKKLHSCTDVSSDLKWLLKNMLEPNPGNRLSFSEVLTFLQQYESVRRQIRFNLYKKMSAAALPYVSFFGGMSSMFNFDYSKVKKSSVYDMDLKICGKLNTKLYEEKANVHLELVRV
jgi:serine/threonine protein kinase